MTVKKQPETSGGELCESANDWFRQFLKQLEVFMAETGQSLRPDSESAEFCLAAVRAVRLTLEDSGVDKDEIVNIFGRIILEEKMAGHLDGHHQPCEGTECESVQPTRRISRRLAKSRPTEAAKQLSARWHRSQLVC